MDLNNLDAGSLMYLMNIIDKGRAFLRAYDNGNIGDSPSPVVINYLEHMNYLECVGGTPKAGASWKITERGHEFKDLE